MTDPASGATPSPDDRASVRAGRRLAEVEELSGIGSWEWDIRTNELHWSEQLCRVYGVEPDPTPIRYEDFLARVHPDDRAAVSETVQRAFDERSSFITEHRAVHPDGSVHLIYGRGYVFTDDDGAPVRMLGSGQDVTELRAEERERTAEERRLAAGQARDEALALIAHDLRSPLAVVVGYVQLLERQASKGGLDPDRLRPYLERVQVAARQMTSFLDDLVADADPATATEPIEREPVDLAALLRESAAHHDAISPMHAVEARVPPEPVVAPVNVAKLERVLHNLLLNAIKYSPDGGTITLLLEADADHVRLAVADQGIGIPADDLPRIFDRFHRGANAMARTPGLGLGLVSVERGVAAHGGRIEVDSTVGAGTTFTIHLPRSG
jgi:two-component system sporulation sensor kinase A